MPAAIEPMIERRPLLQHARPLSDGQPDARPVPDHGGKDRVGTINAATGIQQIDNAQAIPRPLLNLVEVAGVRNQRVVGLLVGPVAGVFRVGLEFKCPNCELPSWIHLDDVHTKSSCSYCDHTYDVTPQLKDRDWRYRRSGIFGRDDNQLGGVPVALTLQQLDTSLHDRLIMYSPAINFRSAGADIEPCESDFVAVVSGTLGVSESPVQILIGEAKTGKPIDAQDVRKLKKLAAAIPKHLEQCFILFSKTEAFTPDEVACVGLEFKCPNCELPSWIRLDDVRTKSSCSSSCIRRP
jgi:hypothetical protein